MNLFLFLRHLSKQNGETIDMMTCYPHTVTSMCTMMTMTLWGYEG